MEPKTHTCQISGLPKAPQHSLKTMVKKDTKERSGLFSLAEKCFLLYANFWNVFLMDIYMFKAKTEKEIQSHLN